MIDRNNSMTKSILIHRILKNILTEKSFITQIISKIFLQKFEKQLINKDHYRNN